MSERPSTIRKALEKLCELGNSMKRMLSRVTPSKIIEWLKAFKALADFFLWLYKMFS